MTDVDTTIQQLEWVIERLTNEAGLSHPDDDAAHLQSWAFPDHDLFVAYSHLRQAKDLLAHERAAPADEDASDRRGPRLGAHAFLTRQEFDTLVGAKGFDRVAGAVMSRVSARQSERLLRSVSRLNGR